MKWIAAVACTLLLVFCAPKSALEEAELRASNAEAQITSLQATLTVSDEALAQARATATALETANAHRQSDLAQARRDYRQASSQADQLSDEVEEYRCAKQIPDMKYDNVLDASIILAAWWANRDGVESVGTPYRDKIWSNTLSQVHGIRYTGSDDHQPHVEHFMVYVDESGMAPGVFWIRGQCWLDGP